MFDQHIEKEQNGKNQALNIKNDWFQRKTPSLAIYTFCSENEGIVETLKFGFCAQIQNNHEYYR